MDNSRKMFERFARSESVFCSLMRNPDGAYQNVQQQRDYVVWCAATTANPHARMSPPLQLTITSPTIEQIETAVREAVADKLKVPALTMREPTFDDMYFGVSSNNRRPITEKGPRRPPGFASNTEWYTWAGEMVRWIKGL